MDYHSMKRSELQKLCKEHKIPANSANSVLADKLSELLNVKQKPKGRQRTCLKSPSEIINESESAVSRRQSRKVRFSPEVEYERSGKRQKATEPVITETRGRRKSVAKKADEPAVDNVNTETDNDVQIPVKVTRSRAHIVVKDDVLPTNERKQGRRANKEVEKEPEAVKETEGNGGKVTRSKAVKVVEKKSEPVKETVVATRATRSKGQTLTEDSKDLDLSSQVKETVVATRATRSKGQTVTDDSKDLDLSPQVKKKSGRPAKKDEQKVEPSKEVKDVPVRVTRARVQTSNDDTVVANPPAVKKRTRKDDTVVAIPPVEKKRTRRDTIDSSENLENKDEGEKLVRGRGKKRSEEKVAEVPEIQDNAGKGTRQTRRNKANVEDSTVLNQNESKVETVVEKKVTRSKASKTVQQLEEPVEEPAGRKNVNRRKSNIQPKKTEVVLPLEEPVNVPARKDTRRKSVVPKVQVKVSKKPPVAKKEKVKEAEKPQSPKVTPRKNVVKKQTKDASETETKASSSGKKSVAKKEKGSGVKSIETEPVSTKDASENEMKEIGSGSVSQKTKKRGGEPVIEEQTIDTEPVSTRKSYSAKKEQVSAVKTPVSRKRAKLSGIKESDSKDNNSMETPIRKMANLDLDDKVTENEKTPAIDESGRRFTRGAVTSNKKEPSQSAIKVQTARKTPGKFTRSGIKKQPSESTHESQPLSDAETVLPEDAEAKSVPDVTVTVVSEVPKEGNDKLLEQSVSEKSERTPVSKMENLEHDKAMETEKTPAIDQSGRRFTRGKSAIKAQTTGATRKAATRFTRTEIKAEKKEKIIESTQKSQPLNDAEIAVASEVSKEANDQILEQSGNVSASESTVDPLSDGSHVQNQNQEGEESVIPEISEKETELTKSGATSEGLENIASVEESLVSVETTVVIEECVEIPLEQSDIVKGKSEEDNEAPQPSVPDVEDHNNVEDEKASNEKHNDDVADRVDDVEANSGDTQELSTGDDKLQDLDTEEIDNEVEKITIPENLTTHSEPEKESEKELATVTEIITDNSKPANDVLDDEDADDVKEHESNTNDDQEVKSEKEQLTGGFSSSMEEQLVLEEEADPIQNEDEQVLEVSVPESLTTQNEPEKEFVNVTETTIPIFGQSDDEDEGGDDVKEHESNQEVKSEQEQVTGDFSSSMEEQHVGSDKAEPSQNADMPVLTQEVPCQHEDVPEVSVNTPDEEDSKPVVSLAADEGPSETVDAVEESEMDLMTSIELLENEQKALGTSGMDESTDFGLSDDQKTEEAELATENDDMSEFSNQGVNPIMDQNSPVDKSKEEYQVPGDLGGYGSPTTEEEKSPTDEPPTSLKNEDRMSQDWGNYSFGSEDDFQKPVSANESDDVGDQSTKDDQASSPAVTTPTDKYYDWTDSSLKALLKTQPPSQASHVKDRQQSTVGFTLPDEDDDMQKNATPCPDSSSLKALFETPAASKVSHVKDKQQIVPDEDDDTQDPDSSMKLLFKTPATTQVRYVKDLDQILPDEADDKEGNNATPYPDSSLKSIFRTPATSKVGHLKDKQQIIPDEDDDTEDNTTQYPDSSMKSLFKTPATTQVRRVKDADQIIPDEDDGKNATPYPDSSSVLKSIFKTPATSQVRRVEQHTQQQSRVKFALPNQDVRAAEDPDSSLLKTPSHLKEHEQTSTVRFTLPEKDNNATPIPYSSLKTIVSTPAATSHVQQQHEQSRLGFSLPDDQDSSLKTLFTTPATAQVRFDQDLSLKTMFATPATSHAYSTQQPSRGSFDALFGEGTKNQDSSRLKTPATSQASHVKEHERSTVRFDIPDKVDSSLKSLFATPAPNHDDDDAYNNNNTTTQFSHTKEYHTEFKAPQGPDPCLFATSSAPPIGHSQQQSQTGVGFSLPHHTFDQDVSRNYFGDEDEKDQMGGTPGTTHNHAASGFSYSAKNHETQLDQGGSSMKELFKTPATTRISHVNEQQQSAVTFGFSQDSQNQGEPKNFTFEELANKYFGDDEEEEAGDDGSFEFKQQAATRTSHINTSQTDQGKGQA